MINAAEVQQNKRDLEYGSEYRKWVAGLDPVTKRKLKKLGIMKPEINYMVSKGPHDEAILNRQEAPGVAVDTETDLPAVVEGIVNPLEVVRIALCDILNPRPGSNSEREAAIVGLAVGVLGMGGISDVAKRFGLGRQAVSKRVVRFCREHGLPPSVYMKSEANRATHRLANVRKQKVSNG